MAPSVLAISSSEVSNISASMEKIRHLMCSIIRPRVARARRDL
jgi:hypothetical protein